ncbi:hypothetical protein BN1708_008942 [Verticillium longisporum]|uniref:Protein kinase domain-containing protein n=1 Tax=Verticillium longisporum TaxID=100787 RepID=A0A0G4N9G2_VERLO|nr:hypothetical protein BN1708_008942 [Verticillium longisporum]
MDVFGTVVNVTTLVGQIVIIYRHVAAMQSFGDAAEAVAAKISFEYFRFETWAEQSGYLEIEDRDGLTSEAARSAQSTTGSHYLLQTAAKAHEIVAQIQNVLAATRLLLEKNQIADKLTDAAGSTSVQPVFSVPQSSIIAKTTARQQFLSLPSSVSSMPAIERATAASSKLKLRLGKETGRLRKLRFSWGLFGEDSDMAKLEDLVQQLRYWNDGLRDILPIQHQLSHGMMTQVRVLGHTNNHQALERVGNASRSISGAVYQDIYASCNMKKDKLNTESQFDSHIKADTGPLDVTRLPQLSGSSSASIEYRLTSLHSGQGMESEATRVVVEIVDFSAISHQDSLEILNARIGRLSHLLRAAARPSNLHLPTCEGPDGLNISHPVLVGFGLGRTSDKTSETIDVRQLGSHFDLYQHPELRANAHKRYKKRHDIYSLGLVLFEIGIWQSIFYFKKDNQDAQDFRRAIRNACDSHLAHFMGKAYQRAVLQCLDEDDMWKEAEGDDDDDFSETHEVFFWKVVRELGGVQ